MTKESIEDYYRFYGARHSIIQLGYLIDFEKEQNKAPFLPRLRRVSHIPFSWLFQREKLFWWQEFITLLNPHFKEVTKIESFYFDLLLENSKKWEKQHPKRLIIETIIKILTFEGVLPKLDICTICHQKINQKISFIPPLRAVHPNCAHGVSFKKNKIFDLFHNASTLFLEDNEIERLYPIIVKAI